MVFRGRFCLHAAVAIALWLLVAQCTLMRKYVGLRNRDGDHADGEHAPQKHFESAWHENIVVVPEGRDSDTGHEHEYHKQLGRDRW
jgi:hypothetical protein